MDEKYHLNSQKNNFCLQDIFLLTLWCQKVIMVDTQCDVEKTYLH